MKSLISVSVLFAAVVAEAAFTVSHVTVQQRWPWSDKVDVDYALEGDDGDLADVTLALYAGDTPLATPASACSGDVSKVAPGFHRITFDPSAAGLPAATYSSVRAVISTRPSDALYLIVDLTKEKGEAGQLTYLTEKDLASGTYGEVVTNTIAGSKTIVWTGVNSETYKTTKYAMRRVPAGTFMMGTETNYNQNYITPTTEVTLSSDFYIGVFETTQRQWELVMGSNPSYFTLNGSMRPVEGIRYSQVRGATANANWPTDGYGQAAEGSFLQKMCAKTGLVFDLPTYAQWQYASAYTVTGYWFNNRTRPASSATWARSSEANAVGRYENGEWTAIPTTNITKADHAQFDTDRGTAVVGSFAPSVLGLYDMHGNVWEFLLDWAGGTYESGATDPQGPGTGTARMWCGGSFRFNAHYMKLGFRGGYTATVDFKDTQFVYLRESGFRAIVMP